jgi:hypothetical protein
MAGEAQGGAGEGGIGEGGIGEGGASWTCMTDDPPQTCAATTEALSGATIVDFAHYSSDGTWGSSPAGGITGKTYVYHSSGAPNLVLHAEGGALHVTGAIPSLGHSGWVFTFDSCVTASVNYGIKLSLAGDLAGADLSLAALINADYPIDVPHGRGACSFTSCDTVDSECKPPVADVPIDDSVFRGLSDFTGGAPVSSPTNSSELLALRFELQCPEGSTDCTVNLALNLLEFFGL